MNGAERERDGSDGLFVFDMGRSKSDAVKGKIRSLLCRGEGLVVLENVAGSDADDESVATWMESVMEELGSRDEMSDFSGTPVDPDADGDVDFKPAIVDGHPKIRLLGNTFDERRVPTALLANLGYQWHQDGTTNATTEKSKHDSSNGSNDNDNDNGNNKEDSPRKRKGVYSMLLCRETPERGAETLFCKTKILYENLSDEQRKFVKSPDGVGMYSNMSTAGGPAAIDAAHGLRMNATGTRRIRDAQRRRANWKPNLTTRTLVGCDEETGESFFWPAAKNFDRFVGIDSHEDSKDLLEKLMLSALGEPSVVGKLDDDLLTISETVFDPSVVHKVQWRPNTAVIWNNAKFLHSTTPVNMYSRGRRVMYQIIMSVT